MLDSCNTLHDQAPPTCSAPSELSGGILRVKLKLGLVNLQVRRQVCEEEIRDQVPEWNADVVLAADDGIPCEGLSSTAVQLEGYTLHEKKGGGRERWRGGRGGGERRDGGTKVSLHTGRSTSSSSSSGMRFHCSL